MIANNKRNIFVLFLVCLTSTAVGQNALTVRWGHQLVTPTKDSIFGAMVTDSNGGVYMAVSRESKDASGATSKNQYLLKFNQDGEHVWSR